MGASSAKQIRTVNATCNVRDLPIVASLGIEYRIFSCGVSCDTCSKATCSLVVSLRLICVLECKRILYQMRDGVKSQAGRACGATRIAEEAVVWGALDGRLLATGCSLVGGGAGRQIGEPLGGIPTRVCEPEHSRELVWCGALSLQDLKPCLPIRPKKRSSKWSRALYHLAVQRLSQFSVILPSMCARMQ